MFIANFCVFPSLRKNVYLSTFPTAPFLATLECGKCLGAELRQVLRNSWWHRVIPGVGLNQGRKSVRAEFTHRKQSEGMWIATWPAARQSRTKIRFKIHNTHTNQNYSGHEIMQTNLGRNELQNTFIFSYSETLIKSQLLRSYSISGGITVFRTPLLMHTTSQSKRIRAQFPDANDLILSYLAVYI